MSGSDPAVRIVELEQALRAALAGDREPGERYLAMRALGGDGEQCLLSAPFVVSPAENPVHASSMYQQVAVATFVEFSHPEGWYVVRCDLSLLTIWAAASHGASLEARRFRLPMHRCVPGDVLDLILECQPNAQRTSVAIYGYRIENE